MEIVKRGISAEVPVAILLHAKRKHTITAEGPLNLKYNLSHKELHNFALKEAEMKLSHSDEELKLFHGFNLMKNNFSKKYVGSLSSIKEINDYVTRNKPACNIELFSILALLNSYVPGSFLPFSRCQDFLIPQHTISKQMTGEESILVLPKAEDVLDYEDLIVKLQINVQRKHAFFEKYLIYSKPSRYKSEPSYIQRDVDMCCSKYLLQHSKPASSCHSIMDRSFPGLFSCLDRGYCSYFLERITEHTRKKHEEQMSEVNAAMNYVLSNIVLSNKDETSEVLRTLTDLRGILWRFVEKICQSPEFFLLVLLLFWPNEPQHQHLHFKVDLNSIVENMKTAFDQKYKKYFRSRYLRPLFFLGQDTGMKRLVHSWKVHSVHTKHRKNPKQKRKTWANLDWGNNQLWKDSDIQNLLLRVRGVFKKQQLFAYVEDKEIAIYSDQAFVSYQGPASFFLGFTIKGPVAYDIKFEQDGEGAHVDKFMESKKDLDQCRPLPTCCTCADLQDSTEWELVVPDAEASSVNGNVKYRFTAAPGSYECSVTGLRWESSIEVELEYCWSNWELVSSESPLSDAVRVFHDEDVGASFETCSLSRFHAKLLQPTFSPKGVLVKNGFRVKAHCEILIYHVLAATLTLHIYIIPHDFKMKEAVEKERSDKCLKILKPNPKSSLQMKSWYKLRTLQKTKQSDYNSEITPTSLKLRYNTATTNVFEVYINNPEEDFYLQLTTEKDNEVVWEVPIRLNDFSMVPGSLYGQKGCSSSHAVCFVDKYMNELTQKVRLVSPIADDLKPLIGDEKYSIIRGCATPQEQMRTLYSFLQGVPKLKVKFYESLQKNEPLIVEQLQRNRQSSGFTSDSGKL
ncbi:hypothetical protein SRHO_G00252310 [Serrasalmus rhombeus]